MGTMIVHPYLSVRLTDTMHRICGEVWRREGECSLAGWFRWFPNAFSDSRSMVDFIGEEILLDKDKFS